MTRKEIEEKINQIIPLFQNVSVSSEFEGIKQLTDLFIKLSDKRCKEQKRICSDRYWDLKDAPYALINSAISNVPLPVIE